jgi:hypothetical protein
MLSIPMTWSWRWTTTVRLLPVDLLLPILPLPLPCPRTRLAPSTAIRYPTVLLLISVRLQSPHLTLLSCLRTHSMFMHSLLLLVAGPPFPVSPTPLMAIPGIQTTRPACQAPCHRHQPTRTKSKLPIRSASLVALLDASLLRFSTRVLITPL